MQKKSAVWHFFAESEVGSEVESEGFLRRKVRDFCVIPTPCQELPCKAFP